MHETFALPPWNDMREVAKRFRVWFNNNAWHKWSDHKNGSLRRTLVHCKGSIAEASAHPPTQIDSEALVSLLSTYEKNAKANESGLVKYIKNYELV